MPPAASYTASGDPFNETRKCPERPEAGYQLLNRFLAPLHPVPETGPDLSGPTDATHPGPRNTGARSGNEDNIPGLPATLNFIPKCSTPRHTFASKCSMTDYTFSKIRRLSSQYLQKYGEHIRQISDLNLYRSSPRPRNF